MRIKFLLAAFCIAAFSTLGFAQSVTITKKTVTYKRPKPQMDFKKSFTVEYPVVKAATPALSKKIEKAISPLTVLRINIKEEQTENQWLETAEFEVKYNDNGVICVSHFMEGTAAYPSSMTRDVVVDAKTGLVAKPASVFTNIPGLLAMVKKDQKEEIAAAIIEIKKEPDYQEPEPAHLFENADFKAVNLDGFSVSKDGVTFSYSYGFPHVIQALEPSGQFTYSWEQIKPYIKRGGLLARIAR
ncbi:MAG: hypothetical protein QM785_14545 [Pyrinomonadaceae bacterium]